MPRERHLRLAGEKDPGFLAGLTWAQKGIAAGLALVGLGAAGAMGLSARASGEREARQESILDEHEEDLDLMHETQVKLTTDVEHLHEEVRGTREDMRILWGSRLAPLPPEPASPEITITTPLVIQP